MATKSNKTVKVEDSKSVNNADKAPTKYLNENKHDSNRA